MGIQTGTPGDDVYGESGDSDTYNMMGGNDTVTVSAGYDTVNAGAGVDTLIVDYSAETAAVTTIGLQVNTTSDGGFNGNYANPTHTLRVDFNSVDKFVITTGSGDDAIRTGSGHDIVNLGAGNDLVDLGAGSFAADGGDGVDGVSANLSTFGAAVTIDLTAAVTGASAGTLSNFEYIGTLTTTAFDDTVVTLDIVRDEIITTGAGADRVTVRGGYDTVSLGAGSDTLVVDYSAETAAVTTLNFLTSFTGEGGFNGNYATGTNSRRVDFFNGDHFVITTGSGNDNIRTGGGNDIVSLGAGDDVVDLGSGNDSADGGDGIDGVSANLSGFGAGVVIDLTAQSTAGGAGTLSNFEYIGTLTTTAFNDVVVTRDIARDEIITTGAGDDQVTVRNGYDKVSLGAGLDTLVVDYSAETAAVTTQNFAAAATAEGGFNGNYATGTNSRRVDFFNADNFVVTTGSGADIITTGTGADQIRTNAGSDTINAGGGNDLLDGGAGSDTMNGQDGNDVLYAISGRSGVEHDTASGGNGNDTLVADFSGSLSGVSTDTFSGTGGDYRNAANDQSVTFSSIEQFVITGSAFNDGFFTGDGNDLILVQTGGDDSLMTGGGNDSVYFGAALTAADFVNGGTGRDTIILQGTYSLALGSNMVGIEGLVLLAYNDNRFGGAEDGPNTYDITFAPNFSSGQPFILDARTLAANETVRFDGSAETTASFTLTGGAGNDELIGGGGRDVIDGGAGVDTLRGGAGNDRYLVDAGDTVIELDGEGSDLVFARTSYTLTAGSYVELLAAVDSSATTAIDLTGNELNNTIQGNAGANALSGGAGNDHISGLAGNDTLTGGAGRDILLGGLGDDIYYIDSFDRVTEAAGEGHDIVYADSSYQLSAGSEIEVLWASDVTSTAAIGLVGNEFANDIRGNAGNNQLVGGGGDDTLRGMGGHDTLDGGAGTDTLIGGTGNDRYLVEAGDIVTELAGEGNDIVYARTSYTLGMGVHVEMLAAADGSSTAAIDLTGNELNNTIQGNAGANVLIGGGGIDYLTGLAGDDTLDGGAGRDILVGGAGADIFRVTDLSHSSLHAPDKVIDFEAGTDKIDFSAIDAIAGGSDDAFTFIGTNGFSGTAGELRYEALASGVHVYGDVDGDKVADLHFIVSNVTTISADDFML